MWQVFKTNKRYTKLSVFIPSYIFFFNFRNFQCRFFEMINYIWFIWVVFLGEENSEANLYISVYCRSVKLFWLNSLLVLILNFIRIIISISTFYSKMDILFKKWSSHIIVHRSISKMKTNIFLKKCTSLFCKVLKRSTINFACIFNIE